MSTPYQRLCAGTPASTWEAELPAVDPLKAAGGSTRVVRVEGEAVPGCGHPVSVLFVEKTAPTEEGTRALFEKGAAAILCSACDRAVAGVGYEKPLAAESD